MNFRVPLTISFDGTVDVNAPDEETAQERACKYFWGKLGELGTNSDQIVNWQFDFYAEVDNNPSEPIELVEEPLTEF